METQMRTQNMVFECQEHSLLKLNFKSNELKILPVAIEELFKFLALLSKKQNKVDYRKIRRESRAIVRLTSSYFSELCSAPKAIVKLWSRTLGLLQAPGLYKDLDLDRGKYEGGFKVWEGTCDLIKFINEDQDVMRNLLDRESTLKVLELGAGSGLASLGLISRLVYDEDFKSEYRIHLQDYNWEVLSTLTLINFAINLPRNYLEALLDTKSIRFFFGDWSEFRRNSDYKYDLIMMSEVLYNSDNYESLHGLLERRLTTNGFVIIATKDTYFGLSGGLYSWLEFVETKKTFISYSSRRTMWITPSGLFANRAPKFLQALSQRNLARSSQRPRREKKHYRLWSLPGEFIYAKDILAKQYTMYWHPGLNAGIDNDRTIYALSDGVMVITEEEYKPDWDYPQVRQMYMSNDEKLAPPYKRYIHIIPKKRISEFKLVDTV